MAQKGVETCGREIMKMAQKRVETCGREMAIRTNVEVNFCDETQLWWYVS